MKSIARENNAIFKFIKQFSPNNGVITSTYKGKVINWAEFIDSNSETNNPLTAPITPIYKTILKFCCPIKLNTLYPITIKNSIETTKLKTDIFVSG